MDHQNLNQEKGHPNPGGLSFFPFSSASRKARFPTTSPFKSISGLWLLICFVCLSQSLHAQSRKFLLLQHGGNEKSRLIFEIGEEISYKTKIYDFFISDVIKDIQPDLIVLGENILKPSDILAIEIRQKDPRNSTIKNLGYLGMGAGALLLLTTTVNSLYQQGDLSEAGSLMPVSLGLLAGGFLVSRMEYRQFRHKGKNKIQAVVLYGD